MTSRESSPAEYRAYIDGLRAIAVLAVLFFHAGIGCGGGYVGVDVFFVISGFLITNLILRDVDRGQFQILRFWERRVRRIMPALSAVVFACVVAGWFLFFPFDFKQLGASVFAQTLLVSNLYFWHSSGYFAEAAELKPLLHTWSLAVEEQFYLLFPFLLVALRRHAPSAVIPMMVFLSGISFGLSVWCSYTQPSFNFYFLPTRAWELLIGALLATVSAPRTWTRWRMEIASWGGLIAILLAAGCYDRNTRFPGCAAVLPCAGTGLVIWANGPKITSLGKLLAARPIVFIGLISYSLYLWHWPVLVFAKYVAIDPVVPAQRVLLLLVSIGLAAFSWKFLETPIRTRLILKRRSEVFAFAGIATTTLLCAGLAIHWLKGMPSRFPAPALRYAAAKEDRPYVNGVEMEQARAGNFIEMGKGDRHEPVELVLWGDSFAMSVTPILDLLCKEQSIRGVAATHVATAPLIGYESRGEQSMKESIAFGQAVLEFIRCKRVANVVLVANWSGYLGHDRGTERLHRGLVDTVTALQNTATRVWIMREVPGHRYDVPRALALSVLRKRDRDQLATPLAEHRALSRRQDPIFSGIDPDFPRITFLDPTDLFAGSEEFCRMEDAGESLYFDQFHLSAAGAMYLRSLFEPIFTTIGKKPVRDRT